MERLYIKLKVYQICHFLHQGFFHSHYLSSSLSLCLSLSRSLSPSISFDHFPLYIHRNRVCIPRACTRDPMVHKSAQAILLSAFTITRKASSSPSKPTRICGKVACATSCRDDWKIPNGQRLLPSSPSAIYLSFFSSHWSLVSQSLLLLLPTLYFFLNPPTSVFF